MPDLVHHESQKVGVDKVVNATHVPYTQGSLAYEGNHSWDVINPLENVLDIGEQKYITWQAQSSNDMTDIGESFIQVRGYLDIGATDAEWGPTSNGHPDCGVTPFISAALFEDFTLEINGTTVVQSQGESQPYCVLGN